MLDHSGRGRIAPKPSLKPLNPAAGGACLSHGSHKTAATSLFLQEDIEKGVVNPNLAVIFDEP
jgi:hypothetical protein